MKKNTLYILLIMLLATVNTAWGQESGKVRLYDGNGFVAGYNTLKEALWATNANTQTVKLFESTTETENPCVYDNVTIDLNGCTVNLGNLYMATDVNKNITITDTSESHDGKITGSNTYYSVFVNTGTTLTFTSGTIENTAANSHGIETKGNVNLNGGTVTATGNGVRAKTSGVVTVDGSTVNAGGYGIIVNDNSQLIVNSGSITAGGTAISTNGSDTGSAVITVNGGTITGTNAGIYQPIGTVSVTGGTISGATGIYQKSGTLNISGGTINGKGAEAAYSYAGNGFNATGDGIVIDNCGYPGGAPTVSISGGNINSANAQPVGSYVGNTVTEADKVVGFISGGTFSGAVQTEYLANDILFGQDTNGNYVAVTETDAAAQIGTTKYATLSAAIAAVENGQTITLLKDIETGSHTTINKGGFTINGNGKSLICNYVDNDGIDPDNSVTDPESEYRNGEGALFFTGGTDEVTIQDLSIKGFAYAIDVEGEGMTVTMTGGETYGRAALNVHGNGNTFTFDGVTVNGLNKEEDSANEAFAAFVLDDDANNNTLNITNCTVKTTVDPDNGYNEEKFIELRGANNQVLIGGSTTYKCNPEDAGGFTNNFSDLANDKLFFDESAKATFNKFFATKSDYEISDIESAANAGFYPLTTVVALVLVDGTYGFSTIEKAFASEYFDPTNSTIKLLGNVTLAEDTDFTPADPDGDEASFTIDPNGKKLLSGGYHIILRPTAKVDILGDDANAPGYISIFSVSDPETTILTAATYDGDTGIGVQYTAANCILEYTEQIGEEDVVFKEYLTFKEAMTGYIADGNKVELRKDINLDDDIDLSDMFDDTTDESFTLNFKEGEYTYAINGGKILLPAKLTVNSDVETDVFGVANPDNYLYVEKTDEGYQYSVLSADDPAPDNAVVRNEEKKVYYMTLQAAIDAVEAEETLTVLKDIEAKSRTTINKGGFTINGNGKSLICNWNDAVDGSNTHPENTVNNPKEDYRNGEGALYFVEGAGEVNIQDLSIMGFAYAIDVDKDANGVTVNMTGSSDENNPTEIYGRAAINNWGSNNTFNIKDYQVNGLNNQIPTGGDINYEYFATFVDYEEAENNIFNIENCTVTATVAANALYATEKFIDLRGKGTKVNVLGTTTYAYNGNINGRGGFTNDDDNFVQYLDNAVDNNKVWFDEDTKVAFEPMFYDYSDVEIQATTDDTGNYPLVRVNGIVCLTPDTNSPEKYYFDSLEAALTSDKLQDNAQIQLLADVTLTNNVTPDLDMDESFSLSLGGHKINVAEGKAILLKPLVQAGIADPVIEEDNTSVYDILFKPADEVNTTILSEIIEAQPKRLFYVAANAKYTQPGDPADEDDITLDMYCLFEDLFTNQDIPVDGDIVDLKMNITLTQDLISVLENGDEAFINFGDYTIEGGTIALVKGATITTDKQTTIFVPATDGYVLEIDNGDGTFSYTVTDNVNDAVARIDNRYFSTLQGATNVAQDGETVVLLKDIETDQPVNITTAITLKGDGDDGKVHQVKNTKQAHNAVAFTVSGTGDVTINKIDIYNPNGNAFEVKDNYSGKLTFNNSTIESSRNAIDVQNIAEGFNLTLNSTDLTVIFKKKDDDGRDKYDVDPDKDPKTEYVNMIATAINFANAPVSAKVLVNKSLIQGFSYGVNVMENSGNLDVTLSDGTFYGRAIVNNWGNGSTFNIDNMAVNGFNNEPAPEDANELDYEYFATIVDNVDTTPDDNTDQGVANYNNYNINNSKFTANADNATSGAATEKFIDLRGNGARVKITGNTTYTYTGDVNPDRGGFTNVDYFKNLVDNNKVWFDETAKSFFKPLVESFNSDTEGNVTILDELDPVVNLYPIGTFKAGVVMQVTDDNHVTTKYYFKDLASALASPLFGEDVTIELLENQTLDKDFTVTVPFTLNLVEEIDDTNTETHTITGNGKFKVEPANSVTVLGGSAATDGLFKVAEGYEEYAAIIKDGDTYYAGNVSEDGIITYLDFIFDETRDELLYADSHIRLETSFKLDKSLNCPIGGDETNVEKFYINFNDNEIDPNGNAIVLKPGTEVFVNGNAENLFSSADPEYTVWYDDVNVTEEDVDYDKKYYLMKDGLAVTVAPATYCGHEQVPTIEVKKRVESTTTPGTYEWITLVAGTDYTWSLVPKENEDDYIAAKTYANSVVIEGVTFQGRRKADFIINPREINDATVKGNEQPYRADGYTAAQIAELISAEYGCIITEHSGTGVNMTYTLKKKGDSSLGADVKRDYQVSVTLPTGVDKLTEIGTYKNIIKLQALEGATGENAGTQNFVGSRFVDFIINSGDGIDIANVLVTSKAVYTSQAQAPSKELLEVTYNNNGTKVVLEPAQFDIEIHGTEGSYVDAKTYSNAITLRGTMKAGSNTLKFYGTVNADYVIAPRDLADAEMGDDKGLVSLTKVADMDWTGNVLTPNINTNANNNIALTMTYQATPDNGTYKLVANDYSYTIEPSPMKDPGEYKVIFTGRSNFTGMNEVKLAVLKNISTVDAEIALQVIPGVNETPTIWQSGTGLNPKTDLQGVVIKDGDNILVEDVHYTIVVKGESGTTYNASNPIKNQGLYYAHITPKYPYYTGDPKVIQFPAVFEYYTTAAGNVSPSENKFGIHVTSGIDKTATVGALNGVAVDADVVGLTIDPTKTIKLGASDDNKIEVELTINGIDDNAFNGTNNLHYVDASALEGYEPTTLSRTEDGPFNGIAKQAIVYLNGDDVYGENYVYKTAAGDYRCDEFKIYDDYEGDQQGFDNGDYSWHIVNKYEFTAATLTNTRMFLKDENHDWHYTTCLPYDLPLADKMKAYTLTAASDNMFGFREIEGDAIMAFTPYVIIPSVAGNLLSTTNAIVKVTPENNRAFMPLDSNGNRQTDEIAHHGYVLYGSNMYLGASSTNPDTEGLYIMQRDKQWKKIPAGDAGAMWNKACVLPMRAYIMKISETGGSREIMGSKFIDGVKEMATDMAGDDWNDAEVYDLQGRKVDTTQQMRKGVYIVNGQKRIRK